MRRGRGRRTGRKRRRRRRKRRRRGGGEEGEEEGEGAEVDILSCAFNVLPILSLICPNCPNSIDDVHDNAVLCGLMIHAVSCFQIR
jgi:hypothetical protein